MKLYGYKKCSTCKKAEKQLVDHSIKYEFVDITQNPPKESDFIKWFKVLDRKRFLNTSGQLYRELKIKDKLGDLSDRDLAKLLAEQGRLVKRPIVTDGTNFTVGFKEDEFKIWL